MIKQYAVVAQCTHTMWDDMAWSVYSYHMGRYSLISVPIQCGKTWPDLCTHITLEGIVWSVYSYNVGRHGLISVLIPTYADMVWSVYSYNVGRYGLISVLILHGKVWSDQCTHIMWEVVVWSLLVIWEKPSYKYYNVI